MEAKTKGDRISPQFSAFWWLAKRGRRRQLCRSVPAWDWPLLLSNEKASLSHIPDGGRNVVPLQNMVVDIAAPK